MTILGNKINSEENFIIELVLANNKLGAIKVYTIIEENNQKTYIALTYLVQFN